MNMQQVITSEQAKRITKGRTPLIPVEYETAVKALSECITFDETKYWSDKADALAAWAKIYRNDEVSRKAKMLKLHAYRRMGQIASELRPRTALRNKRGSLPGPFSLLKENGLTTAQASGARTLSGLSEPRFNKLINRENPISPTTARYSLQADTHYRDFYRGAASLRSIMRRHTPAQIIASMSAEEKANAHELVDELTGWLDAFEQRLPKVKA